jgi:1-acyl-sn-glycerol-3-phosphate acyltransferase
MRLAACIGRSVWLSYWQLMRRYHRYEVQGVEHIDAVGPALIVGYHGRPGARDLCMLQSYLLDRNGAATHAVAHTMAWKIPGLRAAAEGMAFLPGNSQELADAIRRRGKIIVTPGGTAEGCRSHRDRYRVRWEDRLGYLRLALEHRLPILPTAAGGADDAFVGLVDGYELAKRLKLPRNTPLWMGVGPLGIWPLTPPFPVKVTQYLGAPIRVDRMGLTARSKRASLLAVHQRIAAAVQELLDRAVKHAQPSPRAPRRDRRWVDQAS